MVLDVGVVAENDSIEQSLLRKGLYGINEQEMLRGFEVAMSVPRPILSLEPSTTVITKSMSSQLIMGLEASELAKSINSIGVDNADLYWFNDARFIHVREALEGFTGNGGNNGGDENFATVVKAALGQGIDAVVEVIAMYVVKRMSGILMIPVEQFKLKGRSLASYGLEQHDWGGDENMVIQGVWAGLSFPEAACSYTYFYKPSNSYCRQDGVYGGYRMINVFSSQNILVKN